MSRSPKSHYGNDEVCGLYECVMNDLSSQMDLFPPEFWGATDIVTCFHSFHFFFFFTIFIILDVKDIASIAIWDRVWYKGEKGEVAERSQHTWERPDWAALRQGNNPNKDHRKGEERIRIFEE